MVKRGHYRLGDGHFCVPVPWKEGEPNLPYNKQVIIQHMEKHDSNLKPEVKVQINDVLMDYLKEGFVHELMEEESREKGFFLGTTFGFS